MPMFAIIRLWLCVGSSFYRGCTWPVRILLHLTMIYLDFVFCNSTAHLCQFCWSYSEWNMLQYFYFILTILHLEANHCIYRSGIKIEESNGLNHIGVSTRGKIEWFNWINNKLNRKLNNWIIKDLKNWTEWNRTYLLL